MTIELGAWIFPAIATLAYAVWWFLPEPEFSVGRAVVVTLEAMAGLICVLFSWMMWALFA